MWVEILLVYFLFSKSKAQISRPNLKMWYNWLTFLNLTFWRLLKNTMKILKLISSSETLHYLIHVQLELIKGVLAAMFTITKLLKDVLIFCMLMNSNSLSEGIWNLIFFKKDSSEKGKKKNSQIVLQIFTNLLKRPSTMSQTIVIIKIMKKLLNLWPECRYRISAMWVNQFK